ncbi:FRG domain-containing protein [Butyrivibrio proteoclasticus]|uniref:FRG domain-containing protein n=1 Tax=Butyrivibrio proteoclasticus TaxID=43305 RepID=UPI00047C2B23|nr:FRG domain-containing protein [Butyrivibrio proteoclasticus]
MKRPTRRYIPGTQYIGKWKNTNIPVFDILSHDGLNQIIGYTKHLNNDEMVLYRGQSKLYETLLPSIRRDSAHEAEKRKKLKEVLDGIYSDKRLNKSMSWNDEINGWKLFIETTYEAALQHYGVETDCIDFVDNHWTALWFALHEYDKENNRYIRRKGLAKGDNMEYIDENPLYRYDLSQLGNVKTKQQEISDKEKKKAVESEKKAYTARNKKAQAYIFLYLAETAVPEVCGLYLGKERYTVDLRKVLPGMFIRPMAQHGWVVKAKDVNYDYKEHLLCVLRIAVDLADEFLGKGSLLSEENFFPKPIDDNGLHLLLTRQDGSPYQKNKLPSLLPEGYIRCDK